MDNKTYKRILDQFKNKKLIFAYIDLFCGAGGTSTGVHNSKHGRVIACVNHDATAIASHAINHPNVLHFIEDIRTINLSGINRLVADIRRLYPHVKIVLWASLECTNFSKAKGGMARDADSRTLAEHLYRYVEVLNPDYVQIENVVEFQSWGPLDEKGKPVSRKNGRDYLAWKDHINSYGYRDDWKEINSADFGARTSRNRLFGIFAKHGLPIIWPEPTHAKKPTTNSMFGDLKKWRPVRDVIDFTNEGVSIFARKKPIVDKTLDRLSSGIIKFVGNGDDSFITKYFSGKPEYKNISMFGPAGTVTTKAGQAAVFITKYNGTDKNTGKAHPGISVDEPCPTVAVQQRLAVTSLQFITKYYSNGGELSSIDDPAGALTTKDRMNLASPVFLDQQYGASLPASVEDPAATLTINPKLALVYIDRNFSSGGGQHVSVEGPMGSLTTVPKANLVSFEKWIMATNFENVGSNLEDPLTTITANRKWHYLVNPQFASKGGNIDDPCFTLIARMDKAPPYLATLETGEAVIIIYDNDTPSMKKLKLCMAHFGIIDIRMRMLTVQELKLIQGFPANYVLKGTQTEQKKHIGNAVVSDIPEHWVNAMAQPFLKDLQLKSAA